MSDAVMIAILQAGIIGAMLMVPLLALWGCLRLLIKVYAQSKLSLEDYLTIIKERP